MQPKIKYRIVTDNYLGYEAQYKLWWMPFWLPIPKDGGITNTFSDIECAERLINHYATCGSSRIVKMVEPKTRLNENP